MWKKPQANPDGVDLKMHIALMLPSSGRASFGVYQLSQSILESLEGLGIQATFGINELSDTSVNIILGGQHIPLERIQQIAPNSIVLNTLEIATATDDERNKIIQLCKNFQVWDYNKRNLGWLTQHLNTEHLAYIPIGFSPQNHQMPTKENHAIDMLLIGGNTGTKNKLATQLREEGFYVEHSNHDDDSEALNQKISSTRVITLLECLPTESINLPLIGYSLGIGKPVIVECNDPHDIEKIYQRSAIFIPTAELASTGLALLRNEAECSKQAKQGRALFMHVSQVEIIAAALNIDYTP